ncbi:uncharacterized protein LOC143150701 [Ptiloglossa arizonensis]|uniref:uncharacterized protein LOC143150701 n=1 Tax=Ptiloglossa arizonensis TaxID=3350558 RepID=UPI003F9F0CB9
MMVKVFSVILLLLILTSSGSSFGRRRSSNCRKENEHILSQTVTHDRLDNQNATSSHYYDCDTTEFGIVQKIPYLRSCSTCDAIDIDFSSACVRCGMCLAIAEKINQTLLDVHEMMVPGTCLNDTEIELLLRTICDHSFQYYGLREADGVRFISDRLPGSILVTTSADGIWGKKLEELCHYYLDQIGEVQLYEQWQQWCKDDEKFSTLSNILCRSLLSSLRDCRSMDDTDKYESPLKTYSAKVKIVASYDKILIALYLFYAPLFFDSCVFHTVLKIKISMYIYLSPSDKINPCYVILAKRRRGLGGLECFNRFQSSLFLFEKTVRLVQ